MPQLMFVSPTTGQLEPLENLLLEFPKQGDVWAVEYSGKELLNVLTAIEAVLLQYSCTDINAFKLLLHIHGACNHVLQLPVSYDGHANWVKEKRMVADLLAAVFSVEDNKSQAGRLVHLVLTDRSFSRISPTNGEAWTILEFAEECANVQPAPSLTVIIKSQGQSKPKMVEFVGNRSWMFRQCALNVD